MDAINNTAEVTFYTTKDNVLALANGMTATNHCWTAVQSPAATTDALRAVIGGYAGSITTCLKHAVDGYSFWGAILMAKVGRDWTASATGVDAKSNQAKTETATAANLNS